MDDGASTSPTIIDLGVLRATTPLIVGSVQTIWESGPSSLICEATDGGSAFDVGTFFSIPHSGKARNELRHAMYLALADPDRWTGLDPTTIEEVAGPEAAHRYEASSELGYLRDHGMSTHHLGLIDPESGAVTSDFVPSAMALIQRFPVVAPIPFLRDGLPAWDYHQCHLAKSKVVPLESIFRLGSPAGSSILLRYNKAMVNGDEATGARILSEAGLDRPITPWQRFGRMPYDCSTKYEHQDRYLSWQEAVHVGGIDHDTLASMIDLLALASIMAYSLFRELGFSLWDIKWEAAVDDDEIVLVDTVDHDSIRITTDHEIDGKMCHTHLNKQAIRDYYRILYPEWIAALDDAKKESEADPMGRPFRLLYDAGVRAGNYPPIPELDPDYGVIQSEKYDLVAGGASRRYPIKECPTRARAVVDAEIAYYDAQGRLDDFLHTIGEPEITAPT